LSESRLISFFATQFKSKRRFTLRHASVSQSKLRVVLLAAAALLLYSVAASADVVTDWNLITVNATKTAGLDTNLGSRLDAIEAIAVYDAVNSIKHFGTSYHYSVPATEPASAEAAAAQAAHDVLVSFFPSQKANFDASLTSSLAAVPDGTAKSNGITAGESAAVDILGLRSSDGSTPDVSYPATGITGVGQWRPTPPAFASGIDSQWGSVTPFVLNVSNQFRPQAPPPVGSREYEEALNEVKNIGSATSTIRTVDQTHIAQFYKQDAELTVNEAARLLAEAHGGSIESNAFVLALVDIVVADARIAIWDTKYTYKFWRPVTALNANPDGTVTNSYAAWTPLITTPAHPEYVSGHSGTVAAAVVILKKFYGDYNTLTLHTTTAGEPARTVTSLSQLASENGLSRIYGGIHYEFSNVRGQRLGRELAEYDLEHGPREVRRHERHGRGDGDSDDDRDW